MVGVIRIFHVFPYRASKWTVVVSVICILLMLTITWYAAVQKEYTPEPRLRAVDPYVSYRVEADEVAEQSGVNLTIQGSVIIENGGTLTIKDSVFRIDSDTNGLQRITVEENAELTIQNSTIMAKDPALR